MAEGDGCGSCWRRVTRELSSWLNRVSHLQTWTTAIKLGGSSVPLAHPQTHQEAEGLKQAW